MKRFPNKKSSFCYMIAAFGAPQVRSLNGRGEGRKYGEGGRGDKEKKEERGDGQKRSSSRRRLAVSTSRLSMSAR